MTTTTTTVKTKQRQLIVEMAKQILHHAHVCVCVLSSHSFWTTSSSLDVPAGVTPEEGHTGFLTHLLSAVRALIFLARRIQPFLSLVEREVEFCVLTISSFSTRWAFFFIFLFFSEKNRELYTILFSTVRDALYVLDF